MNTTFDLPVSGQRIAVPVLSSHTTPDQRSALRKQIHQLRNDVYRLVDMADQRFPSYSKLAARSIETMEEVTGLIFSALWKETADDYQAAKTQGGRA